MKPKIDKYLKFKKRISTKEGLREYQIQLPGKWSWYSHGSYWNGRQEGC